MSVVGAIYHGMPKGLIGCLRGIRNRVPSSLMYGRKYLCWRDFLKESEAWGEEKKTDYEIKKLRDTLKIAYYNTDYYKRLFDDCGFDVENFRYLDQIQRIPFLTKQIIQENMPQMINRNIDKKKERYITTGGSTGTPLGFYRPIKDVHKETAFVQYIWSTVGYKNTDRMAVIRGEYLGDCGPTKKEGNRLYISSYHMNDNDMDIQYGSVKKYKPLYMHAYPSSASILADYIIKNNLEPIDSIKAIFTSSENLYYEQRELIEKAFRCSVLDLYGHTEHVCLAANLNYEKDYSIFWQYGYHEMVELSGFDADQDCKLVELVGTSYDNNVMPLIRYKTMDIAKFDKRRGKNRKNYVIIDSIEGRLQELLYTPSGRRISMTAINMHDSIFDNVKQFQFYQDKIDKCMLYIVRGDNYNENDEREIMKRIGAKLQGLEMVIRYVDEIPRTQRGKYRFLVQKLVDI